MGWSSGSGVFTQVAGSLDYYFPLDQENAKIRLLVSLGGFLEDCDCDTLEECFGETTAGDKALETMGYHNYKPNTCEWIEDPDIDKCSCGWEQRW